MLIMFIKRFEILGYWRLGSCKVSYFYLIVRGFCATLHYKSTRNLAISWRVLYSQGLVYIPVQIEAFCLHISSPDVLMRVNILISLTEKCWMMQNGAINITGWVTGLCSVVWSS